MKFKNFLSKEIFVCIITQPAFISSLVFFRCEKFDKFYEYQIYVHLK